MPSRRHVVVFLASLMFFGVPSLAQDSGASDVLKARETALAGGNATAALELFARDAIVVTSTGRLLRGSSQVARWINEQVSKHQREDPGPRQLQGSKLTWTARVHRDDWEKSGISPLDLRQDAIVENGKIRFFSATFSTESAEKLEAALKKTR